MQNHITALINNLTSLLIKFADNPDEECWKGYFYAIILTATAVVQTLFLGQYFQSVFVMEMQIKLPWYQLYIAR